MKKTLIIIFLIISSNLIFADEIRGIWATSWEIDTKAKIDSLVNDAYDNNFNVILPEIRYRADALYKPNKINKLYKNQEEKSYILKENFDPLEYIITKAKAKNIKIFAWATIFVVTPHSTEKLSKKHVYNKHKEWITYSQDDKIMPTTSASGAFLDPGVPAVQDYTVSVLKDIVANYDIDGFQLDYIRYPGKKYGYNPIAKLEYQKDIFEYSFKQWKEQQVSRFMKRCYVELKNLDKNLIVTSAVFPDLDVARKNYSQNWQEWIDEGYVDYLFFMAYNSKTSVLETQISNLNEKSKKKVIVGLRAWADFDYPVQKINDKIQLIRKSGFPGFSLFHYGGMVTKRYFGPLKFLALPEKIEPKFPKASFNYIFGYTEDENDLFAKIKSINSDKPQESYIDNNGFYSIKNKLKTKHISLILSHKNYDFFTEKIDIKSNFTRFDFIKNQKTEEKIELTGKRIADAVVLNWQTTLEPPLEIYRRNISLENDYSLCKVVIDRYTKWNDKYILPEHNYKYKIVKSDSVQSNEVFINK